MQRSLVDRIQSIRGVAYAKFNRVVEKILKAEISPRDAGKILAALNNKFNQFVQSPRFESLEGRLAVGDFDAALAKLKRLAPQKAKAA